MATKLTIDLVFGATNTISGRVGLYMLRHVTQANKVPLKYATQSMFSEMLRAGVMQGNRTRHAHEQQDTKGVAP
eukprot:323882-Pelagomonas_calceolata.AAC.4